MDPKRSMGRPSMHPTANQPPEHEMDGAHDQAKYGQWVDDPCAQNAASPDSSKEDRDYERAGDRSRLSSPVGHRSGDNSGSNTEGSNK